MTADSVDARMGACVRERRLALGLSQVQLAERLSLSYQALAKFERGRTGFSLRRLLELAEALDVDAADWLRVAQLEGRAAPSDQGATRTAGLLRAWSVLPSREQDALLMLAASLATRAPAAAE